MTGDLAKEDAMQEGGVFNEDSLRAAIVDRWGEYGAHVEVFDHILKLARQADATVEATGWFCHPTPDGRGWMSFHDKNSVHMDACVPVYVKVRPWLTH